jgi:DNA primase
MTAPHPEQKKEEIRTAADIVEVIGEHVQLKKAGANYTGFCPFHSEKTPSFTVFPQTKTFKCFGCGESGDVFAFLMKQRSVSFPEAMRELADRCGIEMPSPQPTEEDQRRDLLHQINAEAARLFHEHLTGSPEGEAARQYLAQRGVPQELIARYQLGYAPDGWEFISSRLLKQFPADAVKQAGLIGRKNSGKGFYDRFRRRIMFPIMDAGGKVCGFSGRVLDDKQPKYLNSPESPVFKKGSLLFGLHQHRQEIRQSSRAVIVEGNFDLLTLAAQGIGNAVAPLGTALTAEQVRLLHGYCKEAVLLFDGDEAGMKAAKRSVPLFLAEGMEGKAALLPAGHDPDSFIRAQGAAAAQELIGTAQELPEFVFDALVKEHGSTLAGKNRIMPELAKLVKLTTDRAQKELTAAHWAGQLGISPELLLAEAEKLGAAEQEKSEQKHSPAQAAQAFEEYPAETLHMLQELNEQYAACLLSGKFRVLHEYCNEAMGFNSVEFADKHSFADYHANRKCFVYDSNQKRRKAKLIKTWMEWEGRRSYDSVVFAPDGKVSPKSYNLFRGFAVKPRPGDWSFLQRHIREGLCGGNEQYYKYLISWMARIIQNPGGKRPGVSVVLRGGKGIGKGTLANCFGKLFGEAFVPVSSNKGLTGDFNMHLAKALLVFADEAVWGGDKQAEGRLKALITEQTLDFEPKGIDKMTMKNHVNLIIASNEEWAVPASEDERRFFVLDIEKKPYMTHDFWAKLNAQMENGGYEAMMHDLLQWDCSAVNLRDVPQTEGLIRQKMETMGPVMEFWHNLLDREFLLSSSVSGGPRSSQYEDDENVSPPIIERPKDERILANQWPSEVIKEEIENEFQKVFMERRRHPVKNNSFWQQTR